MIHVAHTNISTGHGHDVKLFVLSPEFLAYEEHTDFEFITNTFTDDVSTGRNKQTFDFGVSRQIANERHVCLHCDVTC